MIMFLQRRSARNFAGALKNWQLSGPLVARLFSTSSCVNEFKHEEASFVHENSSSFTQPPYQLTNTYRGDPALVKYLRRLLPPEVFNIVNPDLERFGGRCSTDIYKLGEDCELNPPKLDVFNAWGERIDRLVTCHAWKKMKDISAEEQLINLAYRRRYAEHSRVYQMAKVYLFSPSSGLFACPLAMTDGAAKTLEGLRSPELATAFERLSSASPDKFWTSGQWMTEKRGGSDVGGGTETVAVPAPDGSYRLYGYKWFSSASDSDVSLSLARSLDEQGQPVPAPVSYRRPNCS